MEIERITGSKSLLSGTGKEKGKSRPNNLQIRETILSLIVVLSCVAVVFSVLVVVSGDVVQWIVKSLAWLKGVSLDEKLYGISRSRLWADQLRRLGSALGIWGGLVGLCVTIPWRFPNSLTIVLRAVIFYIAFVFALWCRNAITLPFSNPSGIVGVLSQLRQNPGDNTLHYVFVVIIAAAAVGIFDYFWTKRRRQMEFVPVPTLTVPWLPRLLAMLCAIGLVVLVVGERYTWHSQVPLDTFHEGETLGPAVHWEHGEAPYRDFVIVHGPFQDPLRAELAFTLFGRSIAASRTLESLLEIAAMCLFALLIFRVLDWDPVLGVLGTVGLFLFICSKPFATGFTIPHRDITLYLFLFSAISLYRLLRQGSARRQKLRMLGLFFMSSAIPLASFAYSVDRGLYLTVGAMLTIPLLHWMFVKRLDVSYLAAMAAGTVAGVLVLGLSIRWAFSEFLAHVFGVLPDLLGLGFSLPYPFESIFGIVPLLLTAFNASWLTHQLVAECLHMQSIRKGVRQFAENTFVEVLLFALSVVFYRSALGRAGLDHIYYSSGLIFLLTSVILIRHIWGETIVQFSARYSLRFAIGLMLAMGATILYLMPGLHTSLWFRFPLGAPDDEAIRPNYRHTIAYLRDSLSTDSQFLTLTSEGVWEYFIGRPSPTRFPIVYYAMPTRYQEELIKDMELRHVDYVLYRSKHWANTFDGISCEKRLPRVAQYIVDKYEPFRIFDDQQLWRRRQNQTD